MKLSALRAIEAAATKGPMRIHVGYVPKSDFPHLATLGTRNDTTLARFANPDEAQATAAARNHLPALLAVVEAAERYTDADPETRANEYRDLCKALADLEAVE